MNEEYWFASKSCFSCGGTLKRKTTGGRIYLVCEKCGVPNASIPKVKKDA